MLLQSVPSLDIKKGMLPSIKGYPPKLTEKICGCSFYPRCPKTNEICRKKTPPFFGKLQKTACWLEKK
jgi:oligopeptide/dipeptide ABC transporter ATP-binding protein